MIITEHCNAFSHSLVRNLRVTRPPFNSTLASFDALPLQRSTYEAHKLELVVVVSGPECKKKPSIGPNDRTQLLLGSCGGRATRGQEERQGCCTPIQSRLSINNPRSTDPWPGTPERSCKGCCRPDSIAHINDPSTYIDSPIHLYPITTLALQERRCKKKRGGANPDAATEEDE